jgi:hypothetical protein
MLGAPTMLTSGLPAFLLTFIDANFCLLQHTAGSRSGGGMPEWVVHVLVLGSIAIAAGLVISGVF